MKIGEIDTVRQLFKFLQMIIDYIVFNVKTVAT